MKARQIDYIRMDCKRAFLTWKWLASVFGIFIALLWTRDNLVADVILWINELASDSYLIQVALVMASIPYAASFCEDMEYKYDMQLTLRGTENAYWISKVITVFLSSASAMFTAFMLDAGVYWLRYGEPHEETLIYLSNYNVSYGNILNSGQYVVFVCLIGIQIACLAGTMAVFGLCCSLFVRNQMMVYALPVAILFVWDQLAIRFLGLDIGASVGLYSMGITSIGYQMHGQMRWLYYLEIFLVLCCCSMIIYVKRKKR